MFEFWMKSFKNHQVKFGSDIHVPLRMNCYNFGNPLNLQYVTFEKCIFIKNIL